MADEIIITDQEDLLTVRIPGKRAVAELTPFVSSLPPWEDFSLPEGKWFWFNRLINQSGEPGLGGKLLDRLLEYCQEKGYSIFNTVNAYGKFSQHYLERWYIKKGFRPLDYKTYRNGVLIWRPASTEKEI